VEFIKATEIASIDDMGHCLVATTTAGDEIAAKAMVIATGSEYKMLEVPGERKLLGYKIHFCSTCDGPFYKGKEVIVMGGGNSVFEESVFLARFASKVTIVGRSDEWKASAILKQKISEIPNVELVKNKVVKEFIVGPKKTLKGVKFYDKETKKDIILYPDGVFIFIGIKPNAVFVKDFVDCDEGGFIVTKTNMMTSTPGLFAAGDCRAGSTKQAAAAAGEGATVALMIRDYLKKK
jgi:thioredoxin reductase (NADPH)